MPPRVRDRLIVGTAAALAAAVPILLLWPATIELHDQPVSIVTTLPPIALALTGSAARAPLFSPTRSPAEETAAPGNAGAPLQQRPTLVGIALGHGASIALVKAASGDTVPAHVGEDIDGWRVAAIARDHVTIMQGEQRMDLGLDFANKPEKGPPSPPAMTPPPGPSPLPDNLRTRGS